MSLADRIASHFVLPVRKAVFSATADCGIRFAYVALSILYISLCMHLPVTLHVNALADDGLFYNNAISLLNVKWLGLYDQMTLGKGPTFPIFLALNALLGLPVTLSIALVYLFSCFVLIRVLKDLGVGRYLVLLIFTVILFHPNLFLTRIIRNGIYPALTLIVIVGAMKILTYKDTVTRMTSLVPYGLVFGFFWLTREEGIWIVPAILLIVAYQGVRTRREHAAAARFVRYVAVAALAAYLPVFAISVTNMLVYGKYEAVDINGAAFSGAMKSLYSVSVENEIPYLPVSADKRKLIYQVSPAFRELEDYFEDKGKGWTQHGCARYPHTCGDYAAGWFIWALRDAVASRGYYDTPIRAEQFYKRLSGEIEAARERGDISCRTNPVPLMPRITHSQLAAIPQAAVMLARLALVQDPVAPLGGESSEPLERLQVVRLFLGNPRSTLASSEMTISLSGWYYAKDGGWISLQTAAGGPDGTRPIARLNSPDVAEHLANPGANRQRFSFTVIKNEGYRIVPESKTLGGVEINALLDSAQKTIDLGEGRLLHLDGISATNNAAAYKIPFAMRRFLAVGYRLLMPLIVSLGILGYFWGILRLPSKTGRPGALFVCASALWLAVAARGVLLILVDISSFPAIKGQYFAPAFPLVCVAALVSLSFFWNSGQGSTRGG